MSKKSAKCQLGWMLALTALVATVWLSFSQVGGRHDSTELAQAIVAEIRSDVLMGNASQIEAKLERVQKEQGLAYLSFQSAQPRRSGDQHQIEWQLAASNTPALETFPVQVGGWDYGWLRFANAPTGHDALVLVFGLYVVLFVLYVWPQFMSWSVNVTEKSMADLRAIETSALFQQTQWLDKKGLGVRFTAFRSVQSGRVQLHSPSIQVRVDPLPALLPMREMAELAMRDHLYRPAYKWLLVHALRVFHEQNKSHNGMRLLLPVTGWQLIDQDYLDELLNLMLIEDVQPQHIIIEFHESLIGRHTRENLVSALTRWREKGFGLCVDGYGSTDKSELMMGCGRITHVKWIADSDEWTSAYWLQKGQALARLVEKSAVQVIRVGMMGPNSEYPLAKLVSLFTHERHLYLSPELKQTLLRRLLDVTYQDVYRHDL